MSSTTTPTDPKRVQDAAEFAAALSGRRTELGLSVRAVSRATGIPAATLGGWFSGRHLPPVTQPEQLTALLEALEVPPGIQEDWRAALHRVRRAARPRRDTGAGPYRGLESYGVDDASWFFGREQLVDELSATVRRLLRGGDVPRVLSLVGASGSGKTSLLDAGLRSRLEEDGVATHRMVPGGGPLDALRAVEAELGPGPTVVVVDQLEEVFDRRVGLSERREMLRALAELAHRPATVLALGLRADFYGHAVIEPDLVPLLRTDQVLVAAMDVDALRRVVLRPAERAGASVEPELLDLLIRDLTPRGGAPEPSSLPLLSHALRATWQRARSGRLTVADYVAVGGVAGAVQRTAEEVFTSLDAEGRLEAQRLFAQLVNLDEDGLVTRRRLRHRELADESESHAAVIEAFVAGRILTATEDTLEISHEVLLDAWPRLRGWVAEDRDAIRVRRRISQAAAVWDEHGREPAGLLRGTLLGLARRQVEREDHGLTAVEREFVQHSLEDEADRQQTARRRTSVLRGLVVGLTALALVATALSVYLVRAVDEVGEQRAAAEAERNRAQSRQMAAEAEQTREAEPALAMQLALAAYRMAPTVEARSALLEVSAAPMASRLVGPQGPMEAVAGPDGRTLATVGSDGRIRLWRREAGRAPEPTHTLDATGGGELYAAAFSPDGRTLVAGGGAGEVTVVDVSRPGEPVLVGSLDEPESAVQDLAFSPDGRTLYAATSDPALHRWRFEADGPVALPPVRGFPGSVQAVAQSSAGVLATGSAGGLVRLWTVRGSRLAPLRRLSAGSGTIRSVAFSPDGRILAAGSTDKQVRVWRTRDGRPLVDAPLEGFSSWVNALSFSADGKTLVGAASGGLAQAWSTRSWQRTWSAQGSANHTSVVHLPGGEGLMTGSLDGVARILPQHGPVLSGLGDNIWGLGYPADGEPAYVGVGQAAPAVLPVRHGPERLRPARPLPLPARAGTLDGAAAVAADGRTVVGGTTDGSVVVWRLHPDGRVAESHVLGAAEQLVENVAFSADGRRFAVSSDDGTAAVYATGTAGRPVRVGVVRTETLAMGVALDPAGELVAVGGADSLVHLWRVDDEGATEVGRLEGFDSYVYGAAFSADGSRLVAGSADGTVRRWDVSDPSSPEPLGGALRGPDDGVFSVSLDASGELLAAASQDGRVWLWRVDGADADLYARLDGLGGAAFQVAHRPGTDTVTAAGADGRVATWTVDPESVAEAVCRVSGSGIRPEEWAQHVPGAPYAPPCTA